MASVATATPTYDDAQRAVNDLKTSMTADKQKAVDKEIAKKMADPETSKSLLQQVQDLGDSTKKVYDAFNRVSTGLGEVDQNDYKDEHGKPLAKLKPQWDGFKARFIKLVWESRDTATNTASYAKEFKDAYLPAIEQMITAGEQDPSKWTAMVNGIQGSLKKFAERPNPALAKSPRPVPPGADPYTVAEAHSQAFLDLKDEIVAFSKTFASFAKFKEGELTGKIAQLGREIDNLTTEIEMYKKIIKGLGIAIGATVVGAGALAAGALAAFGPLGPAVAVGVLIVGALAVIGETTTLIVYLKKQADAQTELDAKIAEKTRLEAELKKLLELRSKLESQNVDINFICGRLDQFANIWSSVQFNAKEVNNVLNGAMTEDFFFVLKNQISILKDGQNMLYEALKLYATKVSGSGIPPS